ncbi:MAG: hypothetical protein HGA47_14065 [Zoogloea sp.]|nr:hypothetical protein [Zoogloea sp.]
MARLLQGFLNPAGNHAPAPAHRVAAIHTGLHGRLRLKAHGLYRSEAARRRIEAGLGAHPGVKAVSANPLTGNVLILYLHPASPEGIAAELERLLDGKAHPGTMPGSPGIEDARPPAPHTRQPQAQAHALETSPPWHALDHHEVLDALGSSRHRGLDRARVAQALARHGPNVLPQPPVRSPWAIFLGQFNSLPVALLLGSTVLSAFTGGLADAAIILGVVLINAAIGHVTEIQTERAIQSLAETRRQRALVLREGSALDIDAAGLVPGDILMLVPGSAVTADVRLIEVRNLSLDESALTGESLPSSKIAAPLDARELPLGDRINMAYMGTVVTGGSGLGVVVATGRHTQIGAIQALVSDARPPQTPMQRQLDRLGRQMVWLSAGTCGLVCLLPAGAILVIVTLRLTRRGAR